MSQGTSIIKQPTAFQDLCYDSTSLPNDKKLERSKLPAFADNNSNMVGIMILS